MGMYLEAKHLEDLLRFDWDIVVENTSNPPAQVILPGLRIGPFARIASKDVVDITHIKYSTIGMTALREFLKSGVLTLINENSWEHEKYDSKNRRRDAIMAQRARRV